MGDEIAALVILLTAGAVVTALLWRRLHSLHARVQDLEELLRLSLSRIYRLEQQIGEAPPAAARPDSVSPAPAAEEAAHPNWDPSAIEQPQAVPAISPAPPEPPPAPDWESIIGVNWLNTLGILAMVAGIALFLGYSLTQLGPWGRVAIGVLTGSSLLGGGLLLERRDRYAIFSRGLISGGWAILYFTVYAMHGLPAARVVSDAVTATILLVGTAAAMIAHSFRYRRQSVTALAYFAAFAGLNLSPLNEYSVAAALVLALSLIVVAHRYAWFALAVAGAVWTYLSFILRYQTGIFTGSAWWNGQAMLWIYWAAFEAFDLLDLRRLGPRRWARQSLSIVNACGFALSSWLHRWHVSPNDWAAFYAGLSAAYLASLIARDRLLKASDPRRETPVPDTALAAVAAAGFAAAAIIQRFSGLTMTFGLLLEGELIVVAGLALRRGAIQGLGAAVLVLPFVRLSIVHLFDSRSVRWLGLSLRDWTPLGVLAASLFILNRIWTRSSLFSHAALTLVLLLLLDNVPTVWVAAAFASVLILLAFCIQVYPLPELRHQGVALAATVALRAGTVNLFEDYLRPVVLSLVVAAYLMCYWLMREAGRRRISLMHLFLGIGLLTALLAAEVPSRLLTASWAAEAAMALGGGLILRDRAARLCGLGLFVLCLLRLTLHDMIQLDTAGRILSFLVLGVVMLTASWAYTRYREQIRRLL